MVILLAGGGFALGMRGSGKGKPRHPSYVVIGSPSASTANSPSDGPSDGPAPSATPSHPPSPSPSPSPRPSPSPTTAPSPAPNPSPTFNDPSGVPMPTGNLPGWTMALSDDFTGNYVNENKWGPYSGQPNGDP
ncbi:MAG TPA: hypothetical protein VKY26_07865, partial [Actinomycetota bacterium]|nr:hypothetical protein [Actinomycetota bacterium]